MLRKAILICPRCKEANGKMVKVEGSQPEQFVMEGGMTIKEGESFPNKCDKCGSTNVMVTHLVTGILEPGEIETAKRNRAAVDKAAKLGAETMAATLLKS